MKTAKEIKARINAVAMNDWMGTQRSDLLHYLPFEDAQEFLKSGTTKEEWDARELTTPMQEATAYIPFAWDKANNYRGLSAGRSLDHLKSWLWLAGYGDLVDARFDNYNYYGKSQLVMASVICGVDWKTLDNGAWVTSEGADPLSAAEIAEMALQAETLGKAALAEQAAKAA